MALENVRELLKAVKTDPEAKKALQDLEKPTDEEGIIQYYVEAAKRLGYDVTEADIRKAVTEMAQKQEAKTEEAAGKIKAMSDDELDAVAGGRADDILRVTCENSTRDCLSSFTNRSNCWNVDGCDAVIYLYPTYECEQNDKGRSCGAGNALRCSSVVF